MPAVENSARRCALRKRTQASRGLATLVTIAAVSLVWTGAAFAYQIAYYFGSPANPVRISNGTAGSQTAGTAFRLCNEATAKQSGCGGTPCGYMNTVSLFYNSTLIGQATNTYYFVVYQNGESVHGGCQVTNQWELGGNYPTHCWCDTTY